VFAVDVASGGVREVVRLSEGFYAHDVEAFGARVAVFLVPANVSSSGVVRDPREEPRIALVDTGTGRVTDARLPVRAGQYPDSVAPAEEPFRSIEPGLAWDLPRAKLYIADGESDRVFVMDLQTGKVTGPFDPKPKRSMLDVLWSLFGSVADAKLASTSRQNAAVAPDGSRLYVTGLRSDFAKGSDGKYHESVVPLQLRVIDTSDMTEVTRMDGATTPLRMSPDGAMLLYGDNRFDTSVEGFATRSVFRIHLVDAVQHGDVALPVDGEPLVVGFDPRSRAAYARIQHYRPGGLGFASLSLIDLATRRVVNERVMERHFADVLLLGP
jgi:DNA-binding beta-propeller fold protein YncE